MVVVPKPYKHHPHQHHRTQSSSSRHAYHLIDNSPDTSPARPAPGWSSFLHFHHLSGGRSFKRTTLFAITLIPIIAFTAGLIIYHFVFRVAVVDQFFHGIPELPDYDEWITLEEHLPQHNASLEHPEGPNGRYVMFSNQQWGYGFNNQLQEDLLLSHMAYLSNRAYVFQPYTWTTKPDVKAVLDGHHWRSAKIPLGAFIAGPTAGGAFAKYDRAPRAVSSKWWETVCPTDRRKVLNVKDENVRMGIDGEAQGRAILDRWSAMLKDLKDPCIEITGPVLFDFVLIASPRVLSIWPSLSISPILTRFQWSSLILNAVKHNLPLFLDNAPSNTPSIPDQLPPSRTLSPIPPSSSPSNDVIPIFDDRRLRPRGRPPHRPEPLSSFSSQGSSGTSSHNVTSPVPIPGLVALHLRRGDFRIHCHWLADRSEPFAGWNQFPFLFDRFTPPEVRGVLGRGKNHAAYMERCWPEVDAIVKKLDEIKRLHPNLTKLFLLTNGSQEWLKELKMALIGRAVPLEDDEETRGESAGATPDLTEKRGLISSNATSGVARSGRGWTSVLTSKDILLTRNEREVDQAVDMEVARRAEVFIGNGFSSLTSNIVMLRLIDSTPIENIRFW